MIPTNRLYFGDNLEFLRKQEYFPSASVDLIYLDPPFNSNQTYNVLFREATGAGSTAQIKAFEDTWHWDDSAAKTLHDLNFNLPYVPQPLLGLTNALHQFLGPTPMLAYIVQMSARLIELHRILKPTGSLYLHCDPTASHYLKLILDSIFDPKNYLNEIIWRYRRWPAKAKNYQKMHDVILFYGKERGKHIFNVLYGYEKLAESTLKTFGTKKQVADFSTGHRRPSVMEAETVGPPLSNVWEIGIIAPISKERMGYQTQKPLALLERIIKASSQPGDVILDPFCGCGTTIDAVETLNKEEPLQEPPRRWIGIDITHLAIDLIKYRLATRFDIARPYYDVVGEPTTIEEAEGLAAENRYQFQYWALGLIGGRAFGNEKKGKDRGVDGFRPFLHGPRRTVSNCLVQVKSGKVSSSQVRDLKGTMEREKAELGAFITLEPSTPEMRTEAAAAGFYHSEIMNRDYPRIQILTIEQLLHAPEVFKIPPGGEYQPAPKFIQDEKPQNDISFS